LMWLSQFVEGLPTIHPLDNGQGIHGRVSQKDEPHSICKIENDIEDTDRAQREVIWFGRILAGLGQDGPAPGLPLNVPPCPASELRAGRAPCVLSRSRHAELGGTGRRCRASRWLFGLLRLRHGGKSPRFSINSTPARSCPVGRLLQAVAESPKLAKPRPMDLHRVAGRHRALDRDVWRGRLGLAESPSNPLLTVADLDASAPGARKRGADPSRGTLSLAANQRPLALGADVAMNRRRSSSVDTRTCSAASSPCATRTCWRC